jgi:hypothetical protein
MPSKAAQRVANERAAEGLLCHHDDDEQGHAPAEGCPLPDTRPAVGTWPAIPTTTYGGHGYRIQSAQGTCPECSTSAPLVKREVRTADNDTHDLFPDRPLGSVVEVGPHKRRVPGVRRLQPCPGAGQRPVGTRYRFPRVDAMVRDFGPDSIR